MLLGAIARLHDKIADVYGDKRQAGLAHLATQARARLGDVGFDRLYRHGLTMPLEEVMAIGLEASVPSSPRVSAPAARLGITRREFEVLGLVVQGMTDQEIADALYIGRRTVHTHVSRLLNKLGAATRRGAVARARAEGILDESPPTLALS